MTNSLKIAQTGEKIDFIDAKVDLRISDFSFSASFSLKNYVDFLKVKPSSLLYTTVELDVFGKKIFLIIEDVSRSWSIDEGGHSESFDAIARSKTALLDAPHSKPLARTWENTTAKTIIEELCSAKNIGLVWEVGDWVIKTYTSENLLPIDIIIRLVGDEGVKAIVQSDFNGNLVVMERDKISPSQYDATPMDYTISDTEHLFSLSENIDYREKFDSVFLQSKTLDEEETQVSVDFELEDAEDAIIIKAFVIPFQEIDLAHSGLDSIYIVYEGVTFLDVMEDVTIIEGKGKVSKPFFSLVNLDYHAESLGEMTFSENGSFTTAIKGHSLVTISYSTRYQRYRATSTIDKALAYTESP